MHIKKHMHIYLICWCSFCAWMADNVLVYWNREKDSQSWNDDDDNGSDRLQCEIYWYSHNSEMCRFQAYYTLTCSLTHPLIDEKISQFSTAVASMEIITLQYGRMKSDLIFFTCKHYRNGAKKYNKNQINSTLCNAWATSNKSTIFITLTEPIRSMRRLHREKSSKQK